MPKRSVAGCLLRSSRHPIPSHFLQPGRSNRDEVPDRDWKVKRPGTLHRGGYGRKKWSGSFQLSSFASNYDICGGTPWCGLGCLRSLSDLRVDLQITQGRAEHANEIEWAKNGVQIQCEMNMWFGLGSTVHSLPWIPNIPCRLEG